MRFDTSTEEGEKRRDLLEPIGVGRSFSFAG
jgi:hypothetical protein